VGTHLGYFLGSGGDRRVACHGSQLVSSSVSSAVSSKGAPVLGVLPTTVMGLGETAPGDESTREVVQQRGDDATLSLRQRLSFGGPRVAKGWGGVIEETSGVMHKDSVVDIITGLHLIPWFFSWNRRSGKISDRLRSDNSARRSPLVLWLNMGLVRYGDEDGPGAAQDMARL
jgi:hypothetical protein